MNVMKINESKQSDGCLVGRTPNAKWARPSIHEIKYLCLSLLLTRATPLPEPPAELAAAKDRLVHGSAGRHQLASLPSSSLRGATFDGTERGHVVGTLSAT